MTLTTVARSLLVASLSVLAVPALAQQHTLELQARAAGTPTGDLVTGLAANFTVAGPAVNAVESAGLQQTVLAPEDRPHRVGLGVRLGGFSFGIGGSGRYWASDRLAFDVAISHYGYTGYGLTQVSPNVLIGIGHPDLSKDLQIRPYVAAGINISRFGGQLFESSSGVGFQGAVGAELVTKSAPQLGFGGDIGYYKVADFTGSGFGGFGGIALSLTAHYYIK